MASLALCSTCSGKVSANAGCCPHCGEPRRAAERRPASENDLVEGLGLLRLVAQATVLVLGIVAVLAGADMAPPGDV